MPINTFADQAAYDAHTPSTTESEVSLIQSTYEVKYDGVNVQTDSPDWGDVLYVDNIQDSEGYYGKHFVKGETLNTSIIPNTWTPVGVVIRNADNKIYVHHYKGYNGGDNTVQWASAWLYELTGMTLDGENHSISFRQPKDGGYVDVGIFTYTSTTLESFCSDLDTWLRANQGGTAAGGTWNYNWHCEYMENNAGVMSCIVICDGFTDYRQYATNGITNTTGISSLANMANSIPEYSSLLRDNGGSGYRTGGNYSRLLEWGETNTTIANPTSNIAVNNASDIVSRTQFNENQYCGLLRDAYGTYEKYIESLMIKYPTVRGLVGYEHGNVRKWNDLLKNRTHKKLDGSVIPTFRPFNYAATLNINTKGMTSGNWYVPGIEEQYWMMKDLTYGLSGITTSNCDKFNQSLSKLSGSLVSIAASRWVAVRSNHRSAWYFYNAGYFYGYNFYGGYRLSVVCALSI